MSTSMFSGQNFIALTLIILGTGFMLDQLNLFDFGDIISRWWPLFIVAYGAIEYMKSGRRSWAALFIAGLGAALLATRLTNTDINIWTLIWPGILIFAGLSLLLRRNPTGLSSEKSVNDFAIFGGNEKRIAVKDFAGGSVSAVFGGSTLDLRKAEMAKDARLDVMVLFGGVEVYVPENCRVVNQSMAIFGGTDDKSHADDKSTQTLTITGTVLFGGLDIKN